MTKRHAFGGIFHARLDYVKERHGTDGYDRLLDRMVSNGYMGPRKVDEFKVGKKYPLEHLLIMVRSYMELFGDEDFDRMSRSVAKKRGIVGFFVRWAGSPELVLRKAQEYWPNFYDFGRLEGEVVGTNRGIVRGYDISTEPLFCRALSSYIEGILENIRVKDITVTHTKCVHDGDDHCEWETKWS